MNLTQDQVNKNLTQVRLHVYINIEHIIRNRYSVSLDQIILQVHSYPSRLAAALFHWHLF